MASHSSVDRISADCGGTGAVPVGLGTADAICAGEPADGFSLAPGQAIVFSYDGSLAHVGFGAGAGGFGIDADAEGSVCLDGGVVSANSPSQSLPAPGLPPTRNPAPAVSALGLASLAAALALLGSRLLRRA